MELVNPDVYVERSTIEPLGVSSEMTYVSNDLKGDAMVL